MTAFNSFSKATDMLALQVHYSWGLESSLKKKKLTLMVLKSEKIFFPFLWQPQVKHIYFKENSKRKVLWYIKILNNEC